MTTPKPRLILIAGGIGSGKSVVSKILSVLGYTIYDCDAEAKRIMDGSETVKRFLIDNIHPDAVSVDGSINRAVVADNVFSDPVKLRLLNSLVHDMVRDDIATISACNKNGVLFVETAIPKSSRLAEMTQFVIEVTAPTDLRVRRVVKRNNMPEEDVLKRINAQQAECDLSIAPERKFVIDNDGIKPLLPQLQNILKSLGI